MRKSKLASFLKFKISGSVITALIYRTILIMFLLTLSRAGFWVFNKSMFPAISFGELVSAFGGGFVFDLSAVVYFNMLFILIQIVPFDFRYNAIYQAISKWLYFVVNFIMLSMNGADYVYFRFLSKRATADVFGTFGNETNLPQLFFKFLFDYWPATLYTLFLIFLMVYLYNRFELVKPTPKRRIVYFGLNFLAVPLVIALVIGAARGGYKHSTRPITISNAARYVKSPANVGIVLNTPFSVLRTYGKKNLVRYKFFDNEELKKIYNPRYEPAGGNKFRSLNVVVIILESFSREYFGFYNRDLENGTYKGYTPFLDSLFNESLTFDVSLANGNKSIDAMPSIIASLPSLETPYIISHYANNSINSIASLLKKKGYYTAFFHGAPNGSMGFDSFARMAGFDDYFGRNEYPGTEDFDGIWGLWDEPFLQFFASRLNSFRQPFMTSVFTLSSHHPFKVPEKYTGRFPKGPLPICETIGYSDFALRRFFDAVKDKPWFDSTLFVFTADHTNEKMFPEYQNAYGQFSIPVVFYMHNSDLKGMAPKVAQQIDIMPTVLSYLHFDEDYIAFGKNLFDEKEESYAFNSYGSTYYLFTRDHVLEMIDNKVVRLVNFKDDRFFTRDLTKDEPETRDKMERKLKAVIQTYNQRLLDNDLVVK
ncbi:MAG: sulfatase-like hydrolase/transferase [Bacteroidales bacterium]